jgi:outer membrane protein OmpA-like peptidoglycan-associated protein
MNLKLIAVLCLSVALVGCMHGRGTHTVPMDRSYQDQPEVLMRDARDIVYEAHSVGAGHFAPYEMYSAKHYLEWAEEERDDWDVQGMRDFANLAIKYSEEAIANGSGIQPTSLMPLPKDKDEVLAEFDRLVARYKELDPCKAQLVAPVVYAHIEANLAGAEHEIIETMHYVEGWRHLRWVEADIEAIWAMDADDDGVADMYDGDPWIPEDRDGYQDADGMFEPKPYPELPAVYFAKGSDRLSQEAQGYLKGIAKMLVDGYSEATVYIEGHTDSDAGDDFNMDLSRRRVDNVRQVLVANGAKAEVVSSSYRGEVDPAVPNATEAEKAKNRRVEIWLDSPDPVSPYCN